MESPKHVQVISQRQNAHLFHSAAWSNRTSLKTCLLSYSLKGRDCLSHWFATFYSVLLTIIKIFLPSWPKCLASWISQAASFIFCPLLCCTAEKSATSFILLLSPVILFLIGQSKNVSEINRVCFSSLLAKAGLSHPALEICRSRLWLRGP